MDNLRILSGQEVCAILIRHGFSESRQRGSHIVMQKRLTDLTVTAPVPNHSEIRIGRFNPLSANLGLPRANLRYELLDKALKSTRFCCA